MWVSERQLFYKSLPSPLPTPASPTSLKREKGALSSRASGRRASIPRASRSLGHIRRRLGLDAHTPSGFCTLTVHRAHQEVCTPQELLSFMNALYSHPALRQYREWRVCQEPALAVLKMKQNRTTMRKSNNNVKHWQPQIGSPVVPTGHILFPSNQQKHVNKIKGF